MPESEPVDASASVEGGIEAVLPEHAITNAGRNETRSAVVALREPAVRWACDARRSMCASQRNARAPDEGEKWAVFGPYARHLVPTATELAVNDSDRSGLWLERA